jgi:guanine deaminase
MAHEFIARVIQMAVKNVRLARGGPFAALIVKDGRILGAGVNRVTSAKDPTAHAEIDAIRKACRKLGDFQLSGCDLYTSCEPCPMCLGAIYWARPARVFFASSREDAAAAGFDDSFIYEQFKVPREDGRIPLIPVLCGEARRPFEEWLRKPDRVQY